MRVHGLIDTGAILAAVDADDQWHLRCIHQLRRVEVPLLTSTAVLTELFHLLPKGRWAMEAAWRLLESGAVKIGAIEDAELPAIHRLMSQYWDRPMDFADATLVYLAERESLNTILTVDRADFETYRIGGRRKFRILPD